MAAPGAVRSLNKRVLPSNAQVELRASQIAARPQADRSSAPTIVRQPVSDVWIRQSPNVVLGGTGQVSPRLNQLKPGITSDQLPKNRCVACAEDD